LSLIDTLLADPFRFSTFSAVSELIVTAIVLYVIVSNLRGGPLRWKLLFGTLAFEVFVNVTYMVHRSVVITANHPDPLGDWVGILGAFHGVLSLIMLVGLLIMSGLAYRTARRGESYFRNRRGLTHTFVALWVISVGSGELLYVLVWGGVLNSVLWG